MSVVLTPQKINKCTMIVYKLFFRHSSAVNKPLTTSVKKPENDVAKIGYENLFLPSVASAKKRREERTILILYSNGAHPEQSL